MLKLRGLRGIFYVALPANSDPNRSRRDVACAGGISLTSWASELKRCGGYLRAGFSCGAGRCLACSRDWSCLGPSSARSRAAGCSARWLGPEDHHVALRFVGDVDATAQILSLFSRKRSLFRETKCPVFRPRTALARPPQRVSAAGRRPRRRPVGAPSRRVCSPAAVVENFLRERNIRCIGYPLHARQLRRYEYAMETQCNAISGIDYPRTFQEMDEWFRSDAACREYIRRLRWPDGFLCPECGVAADPWGMSRGRLRCRACEWETSLTAGTVFQDTRKPLRMWFLAMWFVTSQKNGVSALGLQRALGLGSYETAWTWLHKLRRAMVRPGRDCLTGTVEVDE